MKEAIVTKQKRASKHPHRYHIDTVEFLFTYAAKSLLYVCIAEFYMHVL